MHRYTYTPLQFWVVACSVFKRGNGRINAKITLWTNKGANQLNPSHKEMRSGDSELVSVHLAVSFELSRTRILPTR